jgi:hypothetical protein
MCVKATGKSLFNWASFKRNMLEVSFYFWLRNPRRRAGTVIECGLYKDIVVLCLEWNGRICNMMAILAVAMHVSM